MARAALSLCARIITENFRPEATPDHQWIEGMQIEMPANHK